MPTPGAVGEIMQTIARTRNINVVGVDIGGATTDVFSVFGEVLNRTVSANLGMSYSVSNVLAEAGLDNVMRWVPFEIDEKDLRNRIKNKMIRPTTIPHLLDELKLEQAIAREALRLAFIQHKDLAVGLKGVQQERTLSDVFDQSQTGESLIDMMGLDLLVGSGGVLSHAPRRQQAMAMIIDAFQPQGITQIAVDSIFMMPHLGVLATVNEQAATEVFERDCLVHLGTCVAPVGIDGDGKECAQYDITMPDGQTLRGTLSVGEIAVFALEVDQTAEMTIKPTRRFDLGEGVGKEITGTVHGGNVGVVLDGRCRPLVIPEEAQARAEHVSSWSAALGAYSK